MTLWRRALGILLATREARWFSRLERTPQNAYRYGAWTIAISLSNREFLNQSPPHALFELHVWRDEKPVAVLDVLACVSIRGRTLRLTDAHIGSDHGNYAGRLRRDGLNALCHALKVSANVDTVIVEGGVRNTGRNRGRAPKPIEC